MEPTTIHILTSDVAQILEVSVERVRQLCAAGLLNPIRTPNGTRIFARREVLELRAARQVAKGADRLTTRMRREP